MANFTTSAKVLTHYVDTKAIQKLTQSFGNRLEKLTQEEKYQLCTAIALMLWGCCDSCEADPEYDSFDLPMMGALESQLVPEVTAHVMTALVILQNESPEILAQLLPAVAEYARDDDR